MDIQQANIAYKAEKRYTLLIFTALCEFDTSGVCWSQGWRRIKGFPWATFCLWELRKFKGSYRNINCMR